MKKISQIIVLAFFAFCILGAGTGDNKYIIKGQDSAQNVDLIFGDGTNLIRVPTGGGNLRFSDNSGAGFTQFSDIGSNSSVLIENATVDTSVAANALTIDLKVADGTTDPTAGDAVKVSFRDATAADGAYNARTATAALALVVPSGATLAHEDGVDGFIYVYLLDNASVMELAVSSVVKDENSLISTTVMNAASDGTAIYSTVARANVPIRLISRLKSNQVTAGLWDLDVIENTPGATIFTDITNKLLAKIKHNNGTTETVLASLSLNNTGAACTISRNTGLAASAARIGLGQCRITFVTSLFGSAPSCVCSTASLATPICITNNETTTQVDTFTLTAASSTANETQTDVICYGPR